MCILWVQLIPRAWPVRTPVAQRHAYKANTEQVSFLCDITTLVLVKWTHESMHTSAEHTGRRHGKCVAFTWCHYQSASETEIIICTLWTLSHIKPTRKGRSVPQSKNAISALQISCKLLPFPLKDSWRNYQMINASSLTTIKTVLYHIGRVYIQPSVMDVIDLKLDLFHLCLIFAHVIEYQTYMYMLHVF